MLMSIGHVNNTRMPLPLASFTFLQPLPRLNRHRQDRAPTDFEIFLVSFHYIELNSVLLYQEYCTFFYYDKQ